MSTINELSKRLATYKGWQSKLRDYNKLAKAGFYYTLSGDAVRCEFCGLQLDMWDTNDDPFLEHRKRRPHCEFVVNNTVRSSPCLPGVPENSDKWEDCLPKNTVKKRLDTFKGYPKNLNPTPKDLAQAGFYYTGVGDKVLCFQCGVGLHAWEPNDDPWVEHQKWSPNCDFLRNGGVRRFLEVKRNNERVESRQSDKIPDDMLCVVCGERMRNILSLPCRHLATCRECNDQLYICPICQREEEQRIEVSYTGTR